MEWISLLALSNVQSNAASSSIGICMNPSTSGVLLMLQEDCDTEKPKILLFLTDIFSGEHHYPERWQGKSSLLEKMGVEAQHVIIFHMLCIL